MQKPKNNLKIKIQKQFKNPKSKNNLKNTSPKIQKQLKNQAKTHKNINFRISKPYPLSF